MHSMHAWLRGTHRKLEVGVRRGVRKIGKLHLQRGAAVAGRMCGHVHAQHA
jgi:hypothetical protein